MKPKTISKSERERRALEALISTATIKEAAERSGMSESTLYRYLDKAEFKESYRNLKKEMMHSISNRIQQTSLVAIDTLIDVMGNKKAAAMARVVAAKTVLDLAYQTHRDEDIYTELEELKLGIEQIQSGGEQRW